MPKHLISSNIPKDSFDDPISRAHYIFNLCSNLTNYDFLETLTCIKDAKKFHTKTHSFVQFSKLKIFIVPEKKRCFGRFDL